MKQAVVLIHGIGEQKPMDTLRSFVSSLLPPAEEGREQYWSKPDPMSELFELRKLQTPGRTKTHFFEYYWAYQVEGTKLSHLGRWFLELMLRRPAEIPPSLRGVWGLSWFLSSLLAGFAAFGGLAYVHGWYAAQPHYGAIWLLIFLVIGATQGFLINYVGDAARYLSPHPRNIALRQKIRADGLRLLRQLHDSRDYDRIIIVGHSLGSVIGYDLITRLWLDYHATYDFQASASDVARLLAEGKAPQPLIRDKLLEAGKNLLADTGDKALQDFRDAQLEGWKEQRGWGNPWRISDFVTLGSPLTHARLLLARSREEFEARQRQRELPTCPPVIDEKGYAYSSAASHAVDKGRLFTPLVLHHAAPFAVTRWTNLYFPVVLGFFGDVIGGPLRSVFGPGIKDVAVRLKSLRRFTFLAHTSYWKAEPTSPGGDAADETEHHALSALRDALELDRSRKFIKRKCV